MVGGAVWALSVVDSDGCEAGRGRARRAPARQRLAVASASLDSRRISRWFLRAAAPSSFFF